MRRLIAAVRESGAANILLLTPPAMDTGGHNAAITKAHFARLSRCCSACQAETDEVTLLRSSGACCQTCARLPAWVALGLR